MKFSEQMKNLRKKNILPQRDLAERIHVTRQTVSNWENDNNLPDLETIIRISQKFHASLDELILIGDHKMNE